MAYSNGILSALTPGALSEFEIYLSPVPIRSSVLYAMGEHVDYVYFVEAGLLSLVAFVEDGRSVAVDLVGVEGATGVTNVLGERRSNHQVSGYVDGWALRMDAGRFAAAVRGSPEIRSVVDRYVDGALNSASSTRSASPCTPWRLGSAPASCAPWMRAAAMKLT